MFEYLNQYYYNIRSEGEIRTHVQPTTLSAGYKPEGIHHYIIHFIILSMTLRQQILNLKDLRIKQCDIAKQLGCSSGTVSYHCNPAVKKNILDKKRIRIKSSQPIVHPLLSKEISIEPKEVDWKYSEALCNAKLVEMGYETFIPFIGSGEIDLVAYKNSKFHRIQIKSVSPTNNRKIDINFERRPVNFHSTKTKPYENIDIFLVYDGTNIYKIDRNLVHTSICLRYRVPTSNQIKTIHMASDYII